MALQFNDFTALQTDLNGKAGIEWAGDYSDAEDKKENSKYYIYDLPVLRIKIDRDGATHYIDSRQQIFEEKAQGVTKGNGRFGYGENRQWGLVDRQPSEFETKLETILTNAVGANVTYKRGGNSEIEPIRSLVVEAIQADREHAVVSVYTEDTDSTSQETEIYVHQRAVWLDGSGNIQHRQVFQT